MHEIPARILREARLRAGLNQRELASRAETAQSVVARIELGQTSPTWGTLERLLGAAGFRVDVRLEEGREPRSHMAGALADVPRILALRPADRLRELRHADRFFAVARRA